MYASHEAGVGKEIVIEQPHDIDMTVDAVLLTRVLGNLTKNALEATQPGEAVTIGCTSDNGIVSFSVHNPSVMPISVQRQIFQRSFTTKGHGRGLGTYSSRLITRRYLAGELSFSSSPADGTVFTASIPRTA